MVSSAKGCRRMEHLVLIVRRNGGVGGVRNKEKEYKEVEEVKERRNGEAIVVVRGCVAPTALGFFDFGSQPLRAGLSCGALLALSDGRGIRCEKRAAVASFCASRSPFGMTAFFFCVGNPTRRKINAEFAEGRARRARSWCERFFL